MREHISDDGVPAVTPHVEMRLVRQLGGEAEPGPLEHTGPGSVVCVCNPVFFLLPTKPSGQLA